MGATGKIGLPVLPEQMRRLFSETEHEILVLTAGVGPGASHSPQQKHWTAYVEILGYVDLTDQRQSDVRASMQWALTDAEADGQLFYRSFQALTVYRVKAYLPKETGDKAADHPARMAGLYVREILSSGETHAFLQKLLDAYNTVEKIHSETLGDLILNKEMDWFEGEADWCGENVDISLEEKDPDADFTTGVKLMEAFFAEKEKWNAVLRAFAASELTELANEWAQDDFDGEEGEEPPEITEEEFARRLEPASIGFEPDGAFTFYFNDDDMFWGHSVTVYGNMDEGPTEAEMEG